MLRACGNRYAYGDEGLAGIDSDVRFEAALREGEGDGDTEF
jgi:hypothetical protein